MPHISEHWRLQCQLCSDLYGNLRVLKYYISGKWCKRTLRDPEGLREGKESLDGARSLEESPRLHYTQFRSLSQILRAWPLVLGAIMSVLHNCTNLGKSLGCPGAPPPGAFILCTSCYLDSVCTYSLRGLFLWLCMNEARKGYYKTQSIQRIIVYTSGRLICLRGVTTALLYLQGLEDLRQAWAHTTQKPARPTR